MQQVKAKKALGQHFLTDLSIAERIADTLRPYHDTRVIELDAESVAYLHEHFPQLEGRIIQGDFLRIPVEEYMPDGAFSLIGNYPYNISSQIFFRLLDYRERIPCCAGMLQREVAKRLASPPGNKDYGILSVLLQAWYDVEYLFTVDEHVFNPPPKVKSGVIRLIRNQRQSLGCSESLFKTVVKTGFNQRRKTLRNSLRALFGSDYDYSDPIFAQRPEQLGVEEFISLTLRLEELQAKA